MAGHSMSSLLAPLPLPALRSLVSHGVSWVVQKRNPPRCLGEKCCGLSPDFCSPPRLTPLGWRHTGMEPIKCRCVSRVAYQGCTQSLLGQYGGLLARSRVPHRRNIAPCASGCSKWT